MRSTNRQKRAAINDRSTIEIAPIRERTLVRFDKSNAKAHAIIRIFFRASSSDVFYGFPRKRG